MRSLILRLALLGSGFVGTVAIADEPARPSDDAIQAAFNSFVLAASQSDGSTDLAARQALVSLGPVVVPKLVESAREHGEIRIRRSCYEVLARSFPDDEQTAESLMQHGLRDSNPGIRYYSAGLLGQLKIQKAEPVLRAALEEANRNRDPIRYTLAVALSRLGKTDVMPVIIEAVSDEAYAWREAGNAELRSLTGKSLEDFGGYECREGAYTSGGTFSTRLDALTSAERKADRFRAAAAYLRWLKIERPEVYDAVNFRPKSRRASASR